MNKIMNHNKAVAILGLLNNFTEEDIKNAKRKLLSEYHPDRYPEGEKEFATEKAKDITQAAVYLLDELKMNKASNTTSYSRNQKNAYTYAFQKEKEITMALKREVYKSITECELLINWLKDFASIDDLIELMTLYKQMLVTFDKFNVNSYASIQELQSGSFLFKIDVTIKIKSFKIMVCHIYRKKYSFRDEDFRAALKRIMNDDISAIELKEVLRAYTFYNTLYDEAKGYLELFKGNDTVVNEIINELSATLDEYVRSNFSNERALTEAFRLKLRKIIYRSPNASNNNKSGEKEEEKDRDAKPNYKKRIIDRFK